MHSSENRSSRSRRHLKTLAAAAAAAALHAGQQASAATVGIHFRYLYGSTIGSTINTSGPDVFAGIPSSLWNNMAPISIDQTPDGLPKAQIGQFLTTPGATGISLDYSAKNAYGPYGAVTDSNAAYFSYLDDSEGDGFSGYTVTLHGLSTFLTPGESYSITALQSTDVVNATFGSVFIYSGVGTSGPLLATLNNTATLLFPGDAGTYGDTNASPMLTADTITIVGAPRVDDQRSTLAGLAIQSVPEPSTLLLLIAGMTVHLRRRRR